MQKREIKDIVGSEGENRGVSLCFPYWDEATMKIWKIVVLIGFYLMMLNDSCLAFEIIKPTSGTIFKPGDKVIVKLKIEPNENLKGVWFYTIEMRDSDLDFTPPYNFKFTVPPDFSGTGTIVADGKLQDDSHIESKIQIKVVLPNNTVLNKLIIEPSKVYLIKVPEGTQGAHFYEEKQLDVEGLYSDGIKRELTYSASGTTYTSSDETIVKVDKEGKVTAQGIGRTIITARNGSYSATVDVIVKPYKE